MDKDLILYPKLKDPIKFKVVGLVPSVEYQKCRFITEKMHECFPTEFAKPEIRAMLNLDWDEYLTKMKRRHGKPYYLLKVPVAVYIDGVLIGNHTALIKYITKSYVLETNLNFQEIANKDLIDYFQNIYDSYKRKFVYFTIAIDEHIVGSMLFMLYNDLVPETCELFLKRCISTNPNESYKGTRIHRIAKYSWIQCGGWNLEHYFMACENYAVPHNRRGVLSMCNERRHTNNSTQFLITLEAADWMDYNYVAFGQLIQGAEILNYIEKIPTYYQSPLRKIQITQCGEFNVCPVPDEDLTQALNPPYESLFEEMPQPKPSDDDADSVLSVSAYLKGKYFLKTDLRAYMPFTRYSKMFNFYMKDLEKVEVVEDQLDLKPETEEEEQTVCDSKTGISLQDFKRNLFNSRNFYFDRNW